MLINDVTRKVEIPHEPGEWMVLRKLTWRQEELAKEIQSDKFLKKAKQYSSLIKDFDKGDRSKTDPLTQYDRGCVLEAGIVKWSYKEDVNKENIDKLDSETAEWAFREILDMKKPKTEEERKNA